ncbi:M48 family metalloprotease [Parahaliea maris]|nr:hypothetical protein [Parahaliea maris]
MHDRAMEISADRIGLVASGAIDVAIRALIKTASGLNDRHLRFDVSSFMRQMDKIEGTDTRAAESTHPSILIRCRALIWFSLNEDFYTGNLQFSSKNLIQIDKRIEEDLQRFIDGPAKQKIANAERDVAMWMRAKTIVAKGTFTKDEQSKFKDEFGDQMLVKMTTFLKGLSKSESIDTVEAKLNESLSYLSTLSPTASRAWRS